MKSYSPAFWYSRTFGNKQLILNSTEVTCLHCLISYPPSQVKEWVADKDGDTAICPYCSVDAVVDDLNGKIPDKLLNSLYTWLFTDEVNTGTD